MLDVWEGRIEEALRDKMRVWVRGASGVGKAALARAFAERLGDRAALVTLPSADDFDAPVHGLYQAASYVPEGAREALINDASLSLQERAGRAANGLRRAGRTLLLVVPASWEADRGLVADQRRANAAAFLEGITGEDRLGMVVFSTPRLWKEMNAGWQFESVAFEPALVSPLSLDDRGLGSGRYAKAARDLRTALADRDLRVTPLQLRLAVGLAALDEPIDELASNLESLAARSTVSPSLLTKRLMHVLDRPHREMLRRGLRRLARSRVRLVRSDALALAELPPEHAPLVTQCVAFGDGAVQINEFVRRRLIDRFDEPDFGAHETLAALHRARDGHSDPMALSPEPMRHWLEKVHHLAYSGEGGRAQWREQRLRAKEFYWAHAYSLSKTQKDYDSAAEIYRQALERFGDDSYTCHYLAFNLDRAGKQRRDVERYYRRAIELEPQNPWWNGRLVTFLIGQARFHDARAEWVAVLDRIDPERERLHREPWLAAQLHRWVIREWLLHGQVEAAREVMDDIPSQITKQDDNLADLEERLRDAEEARALGESVYPVSVPTNERWRAPRLIPKKSAKGSPRVAWYPGRVVEASSRGVTLVVATPHEDPEQRRVILREMSKEEWVETAWCAPKDAKGFVEVGRFADDEVCILPLSSGPDTYELGEQEQRRLLRYVRRWQR
ncbi:hypothetical protein [Haliangium sp.]|uniref:hypothetical protein n=1 Tax=Haliangium sp. TaxID=2663208 RepID=UPI003D148176